jgi:hypothetical protein
MSALVPLVACGSESSRDADAASVVCNELRGFDDELVGIVNDSVAGIETIPAASRAGGIAEGLEAAHAAVAAWAIRIDQIELPGIAEAETLRAQLHGGADAALAVLVDQRADLSVGPIDDHDVQGAVGAWFNSIEKVMSVSEPEIFRFERRELKQAFLDEPACRNVVQQFVND